MADHQSNTNVSQHNSRFPVDEEWRSIIGYQDLYEVSDFGRVRRLAGSPRCRVTRILVAKPHPKTGYWSVELWKDKVGRRFLLHRLVALAFLGAGSLGMEVNHLNGNKAYNVPDNLAWVTPGQNQQHAYDNGLRVGPCGERQGLHKLTEIDVKEIRNRYQPSECSLKTLATEYSVDIKTIWRVVHRSTWKHVL